MAIQYMKAIKITREANLEHSGEKAVPKRRIGFGVV
jgi:hypothetical protein